MLETVAAISKLPQDLRSRVGLRGGEAAPTSEKAGGAARAAEVREVSFPPAHRKSPGASPSVIVTSPREGGPSGRSRRCFVSFADVTSIFAL